MNNKARRYVLLLAFCSSALVLSSCDRPSDLDPVDVLTLSVISVMSGPAAIENADGPMNDVEYSKFKDSVRMEINKCAPEIKSRVKRNIDQYIIYEDSVFQDVRMIMRDHMFEDSWENIVSNKTILSYNKLPAALKEMVPPPGMMLKVYQSEFQKMRDRFAEMNYETQWKMIQVVSGEMRNLQKSHQRLVGEWFSQEITSSNLANDEWGKAVAKAMLQQEATILLFALDVGGGINSLGFVSRAIDATLSQADKSDEGKVERNDAQVRCLEAVVFYRNLSELEKSSQEPVSAGVYFFSKADPDVYWVVPMHSNWEPNLRGREILESMTKYNMSGEPDPFMNGMYFGYDGLLEKRSIAEDQADAIFDQVAGSGLIREWAFSGELPNGETIDGARERLRKLAEN